MIPDLALERAFGCPYHGLVRDGQLLLPNGQSIAFPQPSNGNTYPIAIPGLPAIVRSAEDAAADAAQGLQWKTTAIANGGRAMHSGVHGGALSLHGRVIGGASAWVYIDSNGHPWRVQFTAPDVAGNAVTLTFAARRLFTFPGIFPTHEQAFTLTISDCGMDHDEAKGSGTVALEDVETNGARAILKCSGNLNPGPGAPPEVTNVAGAPSFLLVTLSDSGGEAPEISAGISILKAQTECMPAITGSFTRSSTTSDSDGAPGVDETVVSGACGPGDRIDWSGVLNPPGPYGWHGGTALDENVETSYSWQLAGYIFGAWFKDATIEYLTLSLSVTGEVTVAWTHSSTGSATSGCGSPSGAITQTRTAQENYSEELTLTITAGASSASVSLTNTGTADGEQVRTLEPAGLILGETGFTQDASYEITRAHEWAGSGTFQFSSSAMPPIFAFEMVPSSEQNRLTYTYGLSALRVQVIPDTGITPNLDVMALRQTNNLVQLRSLCGVSVLPWGWATGFYAGPILAPHASDSAVVNAASNRCTYDPFTHAIVRNDAALVGVAFT